MNVHEEETDLNNNYYLQKKKENKNLKMFFFFFFHFSLRKRLILQVKHLIMPKKSNFLSRQKFISYIFVHLKTVVM